MGAIREFIVTASAGDHSIRCGTYSARTPADALNMARQDKELWVAIHLDVQKSDLIWEVEEDFL